MTTLSPLSFDCIICFEEFNGEDRHPVVLPCGHTYVCASCARKLDKCRECRATLFTQNSNSAFPCSSASGKVQQTSAQGLEVPSRDDFFASSTAITGATTSDQTRKPVSFYSSSEPVAKPKKTCLAKNTVILDLMEANMRASQDSKPLSRQESTLQQGVSANNTNSKCGTYVVKAQDGLDILSSPICKSANKPSIAMSSVATSFVSPASSKELPIWQSSSNSVQSTEENISNIIKDYKRTAKVDKTTKSSCKHVSDGLCVGCPSSDQRKLLKCGDQIQVVSIKSGWAKLARAYGYVHCPTGTEIIMVADCEDMACKLEGMLLNLASRADELVREQNKVQIHFWFMKYNYYYCCISTIANYADRARKLESLLLSLSSCADELIREQKNIQVAISSLKKEFQESLSRNDDFTIMSGIVGSMTPTVFEMSALRREIDSTVCTSDCSDDDMSDWSSEVSDPKNSGDNLGGLDDTFHAIQTARNTRGFDPFYCVS